MSTSYPYYLSYCYCISGKVRSTDRWFKKGHQEFWLEKQSLKSHSEIWLEIKKTGYNFFGFPPQTQGQVSAHGPLLGSYETP